MFRNFSGFGRRKSSTDARSGRRESQDSPSGFRRGSSPAATASGVASPNEEQQAEFSTSPRSRPSFRKASTTRTLVAESPDNQGPGPLGLHVVYTPINGHRADIVFIHGLGGTSRHTWSKAKIPELFWPLTFLPLEPDICLARILTFGYNASPHKGDKIKSILDFAKDLLFDLKYAQDAAGDALNMGNVPLIFVVHSMGGLLVKEAYMQGQHDPEYANIIKSITAITFLATPHRGTNLAQVLNRILESAMVTNPKQYISELGKNSITLQKLNEQFRHIAPKLDIVSFYETQPTPIGFKHTRVLILEKDSSILGYPGETSKALDADHHGVCKYDSPQDPNYQAVRNILKSIVSKIISASGRHGRTRPAAASKRDSLDLKAVLGINELPIVDYSFFRDKWTQGTSEWILTDRMFLHWRDAAPETGHSFLWLHGGPGAGKSIMSSFIINSLLEANMQCQYFFVRFGDRKKRTASLLLRSIAYQVALCRPQFLTKLLQAAEEGSQFDTADPRVIWERVFRSGIFVENEQQQAPLYWIIDGLDEAEYPRSIIRLLSDMASSSSTVPVRVLLVGREGPDMAAAFHKLPESLNPATLSIYGGQSDDLRHYISGELDVPGSATFREEIAQRILDGAHYNFLWVRLAVEQVNKCRREGEVEDTLRRLPVGMEALYDRMSHSVAEHPLVVDRELALTILRFTTCAVRVLSVIQIAQALGEDVSDIMDLQRSIVDLCSGFVVVDKSGNVAMVHQTAREYLLGGVGDHIRIDRGEAHEQLFLSCMNALMAVGLRGKIHAKQIPEFVDYAATSWSTHLASVQTSSGAAVQRLEKFLTGQWLLTWIQYLATTGQLQILVQSSQNLSIFAHKLKETPRRENDEQSVETHLELIESWATDLSKLVGKFGTILRRSPSAIYKLIAPFCPRNSAINRYFGKLEDRGLLVSGLSSEDWDDTVARISLRDGASSSSITVTGARIFILTKKGHVLIYNAATFEEASVSPIVPGERVYMLQANSKATMLATYGYRMTKVWEASTGKCVLAINNPESRPRPLTMRFMDQQNALLVGTDESQIISADLEHKRTDVEPTWKVVATLEEKEMDGHVLNAASHFALSQHGGLAAVAYRGHPLSAWETAGPVHIGHCWRRQGGHQRGEVIDIVWLPHSTEVLGVYLEGLVFKWDPYTGESKEISAGANRLSLSKDGNLFATGNGMGIVRVYATADFSLLYQITSEDAISDVAFAPNSRRFYDIRGSYASIWEPNSLMSFSESVGGLATHSDTDSGTNVVPHLSSTTFCAIVDSITALAVPPRGRLYFYGTEKGMIYLVDAQRGNLAKVHASKGLLGIEHLVCGQEGRKICFSDSSKRIVIKSVTTGLEPVVENSSDIWLQNIVHGHILQLLLHPDEESVLVQAATSLHVISLTALEVVRSSKQRDSKSRKWICHPHNPALILGFGPEDVLIQDWDLNEPQRLTYHADHLEEDISNLTLTGASMVSIRVHSVLVTKDKKALLVHLTRSGDSGGSSSLYLETAALSLIPTTTAAGEGTSPLGASALRARVLSREMASQMLRPLSFLSQNRLLFLSKQFSVCSWQLPTGPVKELFHLPGDWISRDCLALCEVWEVEKSFLCPRNGEVALVKSFELA